MAKSGWKLNWNKNAKMPVNCPGCGHSFEIKVFEAKPGRIITCPSCKNEITLTGEDIPEMLRKLQKDLEG